MIKYYYGEHFGMHRKPRQFYYFGEKIRMETKLSTNWHQRPLALSPSPIIFDIPTYQKVDIYPSDSNESFLHSQKLRASIFESKKAFLSHSLNDDKEEDAQMEEKSLIGSHLENRRPPCKKISFKIKKQSSLYKRNLTVPRVSNVPKNTVAELTKKFNEMVESRNVYEEQLIQMRLQRGDSVCSDKKVKVSRKPSVKTKPTSESKTLVIIKTTRKNSVKRQNSQKDSPNRPTTLNLTNIPKAIIETSPNGTSVKAAIEIFEKKTTVAQVKSPNKPTIPEKSAAVLNLSRKTATLPTSYKHISRSPEKKTVITKPAAVEFSEEDVPVINIPAVLPQRRCDSMYETLNLKKVQPDSKSKSVDNITSEVKQISAVPNVSFLWRDKSPSSSSSRSSINTLEKPKLPPDLPPKPNTRARPVKKKMPLPEEVDYEEISQVREETLKSLEEITPIEEKALNEYDHLIREEKVYEELSTMVTKIDDGYEPIESGEVIYETLPVPPSIPLRRSRQEPLPPRPPSSVRIEEGIYNCYESIYSKKDGLYESIYGSQLTASSNGSNRDSIISSELKSNSLYGQAVPNWHDYDNAENVYYRPPSDLSDRTSATDRSDDWEDVMTDIEVTNTFILVREKAKSKKSGWSQHFRDRAAKSLEEANEDTGEESDHHYESLYAGKDEEELDYDSFESDTESDASFDRNKNMSGGIENTQLPELPNNQSFIKSAEKNMKKFRMNITRSLTRMKKHISKTDAETPNDPNKKRKSDSKLKQRSPGNEPIVEAKNQDVKTSPEPNKSSNNESQSPEDNKTLTRTKSGGFLTKFRRSMSLSAESALELTSNLNGASKTKSTFYLTEPIDIDATEGSEKSLSPARHSKSPVMRPRSPPPPAPVGQPEIKKSERKDNKASSWYADSGVFKNNDQSKRPSTYWYAEVGLYQGQNSSSPSTSSAENSGSNLSAPIKAFEIPRPSLKPSDFINQDDREHLNNVKNDSAYYTGSFNSLGSLETKNDDSLKQELQLRLQDEPLYQFYDAAVLESISYGNTSDFDSDNYEDIHEKEVTSNVIKIRPSAMELVTPQRNSICITKTLWCEIPEVINSSVLSTLSAHQKKLQEAKFEILTSEASYLNSLIVLINHFVKSFDASNLLSREQRDVLFGHVEEVCSSSEKLLHDLEKCWQDNILLHGICDIVQKHAEENFNAYIPYCENQIVIDEILKNLKERLGFTEFLKHLELNEACQSLSLYSFLMLPMQRITRWPLLVDAVLKRLSQQDSEYYACQSALATLNKIVSQCNEAARQKEREIEMMRIAKQLDFPQSIPKIAIITPERYLIRCGSLVHMQSRNEDTKLTFGKRFSKTNVFLFLFNDLFVVAKEKGEKNYLVQHYCPRGLVELSSSDVMLSVPAKEAHSKNLIFLTVLENQDGKMIEYLLSCNSESDKERWIKALTPPRSEDPDETVYGYWDCPQVSAVHNYVACQPDELALTKGDVINVLRKMTDGWFHGERIRDGQTGWFPANYTVEIANSHVRARNLKQRYRLLAFSDKYVKSKIS
ncbi:uncharacterized protein LOC126746543 [Anthonomus grandis grandis]|uniref:uncharacterized protein LOC126746543 n=1 Tax=Anthonomus grandis grandis TaxID=2921223 RepID=UPI0021656A92|nr:uncharacterized protein LOC126746543 [Anthonomus grandis grandis]